MTQENRETRHPGRTDLAQESEAPDAARDVAPREELLARWEARLLSLMTPRRLYALPAAWKYAIAVSIVAAATVLRWALIPVLGTTAPDTVSVATVAVTTVLFGLGPGLMSAVLGDVAVEVFILRSLPSMLEGVALGRLAVSMAVGVFVAWLLHAIRASASLARRAEGEKTHLASFPQINPSPVTEIDVSGKVTYANPATLRDLPDLAALAQGHPYLAGWRDVVSTLLDGGAPVNREVMAGGRWWWQAFSYVPDTKTVRIYSHDITKRKEAEEALRLSREDLNRAQAVGQIGWWRLDTRKNVLTWSPENHRIFGVPEGTPMSYEFFLSIVHPDDRPFVDARWAAGLRGEPYDIEHRIVVDGEVKWVREKAYLEFDSAGNVLGGFGITQDITARKEAEEALRQSELRFRQVAESLPQLVWTCAADGPCDYLSPQWVRYTGKSEAEQLGYGWLDRLHPDDRRRTIDQWLSTAAKGENFEIEFRIRRHDGAYRWFRTLAVPLRDEAGRIVKWFGSNTDIDDIRRAEVLRQALAEQEKLRLGAAVEQASDSIVMADFDGTIRYVNAAFESINKVTREAATGTSYFDLLAGEPAAAAEIREAVAAGRPWHGPLTRSVRDGRPVELEVTISSAKDPSGTVIGRLITEKDVTRENALQKQVRQAQKMEALGTLAGGITHDFNNILGAIVINTELALLDLDPTNPARRPLPLVLQAANRGKELVKQIITFSRQRTWERKPLDVVPVVKEGLIFLRSTLPREISIQETVDAQSGVVLADPSHIHQVLVNLCQNAALAMKDGGGRIEVQLAPVEADEAMAIRHPNLKPGPYARLTVSDTGCGMTKDVQERVFEPFFTTRGPGEGSGLGLAVVHGIIRTYEGEITVYSEPGKGSTFNVYLPRLEADRPEADAEDRAEPQRGEERILLVEDEAAQRESLERSLGHLGYRVIARADGRSALAAFEKDPAAFDIVITDQVMPKMTGLELAAAISALRPDIPILLSTGFSEKVHDSIVGKSGVRELIMKPYTIVEITRLIRKVVAPQ